MTRLIDKAVAHIFVILLFRSFDVSDIQISPLTVICFIKRNFSLQIKPVNRAYVGGKYHFSESLEVGWTPFRLIQILKLGYFR